MNSFISTTKVTRMKTLTALIVLLTLVTIYPQKKIMVGVGYDVAFPTGQLADYADAGSNWSAFVEYPINKQWGIQFLTGYMIMPIKDDYSLAAQGNVYTLDLKSIPVKGAAKYYIYDEFFFQGELGVTFLKGSLKTTDFNANTETQSTDYEAKVTAGGGFGGAFKLSDMSQLNFTAKYMFVDGGDAAIDFNHFLLGIGLVALFDL